MNSYRDYPWFYDMMRLIEGTTLGWFPCSHGPLPSKRDKEAWEDVDDYFIDVMRLEAKGWKTFSVGHFSDFELAGIEGFVKRHPKKSYLSRITPSEDVFSIIGRYPDPCFTVSVVPELVDEFSHMMEQFHRPSIVVTRRDIAEIGKLLPPNHRVMVGPDATAISYDLVSDETQAAIMSLHDPNLIRR